MISARISGLLATALVAALVLQAQARNRHVQPELEDRIAGLKIRTAALVASALARLDRLTPEQRRAEPPEIWKVAGAVTTFRDCRDCPQMAVVPAGEFTMGPPASETGEETRRRVTIKVPFAVSKFEITFDEWNACVRDGGCDDYRPKDQGWGRGKRPVIDISWDNAKAYTDWLKRKTGKSYRLLSESEWEYAARAGTMSVFAYGDTLSPRQANFDGSTDGSGPSAVNRQKTLPVGSFPPNRFGLYDMHGNVTEWVEDCWHDDTAGAPADGSAWLDGECEGRVLRGGSWEDSAEELHSAARTGEFENLSSYADGIRIARDL